MRKKMLHLAIAGTTIASTLALSAQSALAAADFTVVSGLGFDHGANLVAATGTITDHTSGNDAVAVQTFIQRLLDTGSWVTVATGPRRTGVNTATSAIGARSCINGATYRAQVNWNWNNIRRGTKYSAPNVC
ncbi:hypothetical protein ACQEU3_40055 [Spirillospora sp. CA-253888]